MATRHDVNSLLDEDNIEFLLIQFVDEVGTENCDPRDPNIFCPGGKIKELELKYTGDDDSVLTQNQGGKASVADVGNGPADDDDDQVYIIASRREDHTSDEIWFAGLVGLNSNFSFDTTVAVPPLTDTRSELHSDTYFKIFKSDGGALLQTIKMHTSCSKLLRIDDQFGAITVKGFARA